MAEWISLAPVIFSWLKGEIRSTKELDRGAWQLIDWILVIQIYPLYVLHCSWALQISHTNYIFSVESVFGSQFFCIVNYFECDWDRWVCGIMPRYPSQCTLVFPVSCWWCFIVFFFFFLIGGGVFVLFCFVLFWFLFPFFFFLLNKDQSIWPRKMKLTITFPTTYMYALSCNKRGILCVGWH